MSGYSLSNLIEKYPLTKELSAYHEIFWQNGGLGKEDAPPFSPEDIADAANRLSRFGPYIERCFPETAPTRGIIESPLVEIPKMQKALGEKLSQSIPGRLMLKRDDSLPVSGSIKARGGIYEVLKLAEKIALEKALITEKDNYAALADEKAGQLFSNYSVAVGSTGNLGLSIGIISARLGFQVTVHMSADARQWKKDLLRSKGVTVIEYPDDYGKAVEEGRRQAAADPMCHFVDDENSKDLFLGYAVAAGRLEKQLKEMEIAVDSEHPLFVYLPCGVGGGPGGVAYGLKKIFGQAAHCLFAEPTHAPCMLLGMMTGLHDKISVYDIGLDGKTAADGLAVGRPSSLVGKAMEPLLDGVFTVSDENLYRLLKTLADTEGIYIEPSACAGIYGIEYVLKSYPAEVIKNATHIFWSTGGGMVPREEMDSYLEYAKKYF